MGRILGVFVTHTKRLMLVLAILAGLVLAPPAVSSAASGGLVVKGTVVRQANATVSTIGKSAATRAVRGATVRLVWENNAGREEAVTTWAMVPVAEATTDATGGYQLRTAATPAIAAAAAKNDGW